MGSGTKNKSTKKVYIPTEADSSYLRYCNSIGLGIVIRPAVGHYGMYWVEKYIIKDYKSSQYMRIDQDQPDIPKNRMLFTEFDGQKKCFEMYKLVYDKRNKEKIP